MDSSLLDSWLTVVTLMLGSGFVGSLLTSWWDKRTEEKRYWQRERRVLYAEIVLRLKKLLAQAIGLIEVYSEPAQSAEDEATRELPDDYRASVRKYLLREIEVQLIASPRVRLASQSVADELDALNDLLRSKANAHELESQFDELAVDCDRLTLAFQREIGIKPLSGRKARRYERKEERESLSRESDEDFRAYKEEIAAEYQAYKEEIAAEYQAYKEERD